MGRKRSADQVASTETWVTGRQPAASSRSQPRSRVRSVSTLELRYSEERAKDIAAEYRFQYPGLLGVFDVFRGGGRHLDRDELALTCLEIATGPTVNHSASAWLEDLEPDALIEILWQVGFLQAEAAVGAVARRAGGSFVGVYQVGNLNLHTIRRFRVHPMFWAYLGLKADHQPAARG